MNIHQSIQLAKLWARLAKIKAGLDNEVIPVGVYLGIDDPELMAALEELSAKIEQHFERFRLVAVANKG